MLKILMNEGVRMCETSLINNKDVMLGQFTFHQCKEKDEKSSIE